MRVFTQIHCNFRKLTACKLLFHAMEPSGHGTSHPQNAVTKSAASISKNPPQPSDISPPDHPRSAAVDNPRLLAYNRLVRQSQWEKGVFYDTSFLEIVRRSAFFCICRPYFGHCCSGCICCGSTSDCNGNRHHGTCPHRHAGLVCRSRRHHPLLSGKRRRCNRHRGNRRRALSVFIGRHPPDWLAGSQRCAVLLRLQDRRIPVRLGHSRGQALLYSGGHRKTDRLADAGRQTVLSG